MRIKKISEDFSIEEECLVFCDFVHPMWSWLVGDSRYFRLRHGVNVAILILKLKDISYFSSAVQGYQIPLLGGIISFCESPRWLCQLENITSASIQKVE